RPRADLLLRRPRARVAGGRGRSRLPRRRRLVGQLLRDRDDAEARFGRRDGRRARRDLPLQHPRGGRPAPGRARRARVKLLVLGGTVFLGRHLVEAALARGDQVTIFTRGLTAPDLFPDAERLHGDRDGDLAALAGRTWDVVVDTCGFVPRVVRHSAELL